MKVKHLKQLGFKSRAILSKKGGDIFICNDKAFKKILEGKSLGKNIDPYNKSNDYFHYVRTSSQHPEYLMSTFFSSKLDVFEIEDKKLNKKEVIISTTENSISRQEDITYSEDDLLELEKDELIEIDRDNKTSKILSIRTHKKANILNVLKKTDFDTFQYTGQLVLQKNNPGWNKDLFNKEQIELYIKKRLQKKTFNRSYDLDKDNLTEVLKFTKYPKNTPTFLLHTINLSKNDNIHLVCLKEGKDFSKKSNFNHLSLKTNLRKCEIRSYSNNDYEKYYVSYVRGEKYLQNLFHKYEKTKPSKLKDTLIEKYSEENESFSHFVKDFDGVGVHFLSIKLNKI